MGARNAHKAVHDAKHQAVTILHQACIKQGESYSLASTRRPLALTAAMISLSASLTYLCTSHKVWCRTMRACPAAVRHLQSHPWNLLD